MSIRQPCVALDYTPAWQQGAGIGRYVRELVRALAREDQALAWKLFVAGTGGKQLPEVPGPNFCWRPSPLPAHWLTRLWFRLHAPVPVELFTGPAGLYHATDFVLPPVRRGTTTIVQVHDLSFMRVPEAAPPALRQWLERVVPDSIRRADLVLADSQATRDDLTELFAVARSSEIAVLHGGVEARFRPRPAEEQKSVRRHYDLGDWPFVLSVGTLQPRKNHLRLLEAFARLRQEGLDLHLVIAGGAGWLSGPFFRQLEDSDLAGCVHLPGYVADEDLPALYSAATVFAFPSLYEGFGLPVLEAMACATPVVTSNLSSLPEVAGKAALLVNPRDTEAIGHAIGRLVEDSRLRQQLVSDGLERAQRFTWRQAARELLDVYRRLGIGS